MAGWCWRWENGNVLWVQWAFYQILKTAGCACAGNTGNVFPGTDFKGNHQLATQTCITARASRTCCDACRDRWPVVARKTFPAFPAHAQLAILRIWQEAHGSGQHCASFGDLFDTEFNNPTPLKVSHNTVTNKGNPNTPGNFTALWIIMCNQALPGQPPETLIAENDCFQRSVVASGPPIHSHVLIKIFADKRPLN